jgi:hypothetical protein
MNIAVKKLIKCGCCSSAVPLISKESVKKNKKTGGRKRRRLNVYVLGIAR